MEQTIKCNQTPAVNAAIIGTGHLARLIASALTQGQVPGCRLVAMLGRNREKGEQTAAAFSCTYCQSTDELLAQKPRYVIEAANAVALKEHTLPLLNAGVDVICLSMAALYDRDFYEAAANAAREHGSKLHLASGVIGGLDFLEAARLRGELTATLTFHKAPSASPACPPPFKNLPDVFDGSVAAVCENWPEHLNIAAALGLACESFTDAKMAVRPAQEGEADGFGLQLSGAFGSASFDFRGDQSGSDLAAFSAVALLKRLLSPISF